MVTKRKLEYMRRWRAARTPEQIEAERLYMKKWRADHPEYSREYNRKQYLRDPEARRARSSAWTQATAPLPGSPDDCHRTTITSPVTSVQT